MSCLDVGDSLCTVIKIVPRSPMFLASSVARDLFTVETT